jgi:hypothetical protein
LVVTKDASGKAIAIANVPQSSLVQDAFEKPIIIKRDDRVAGSYVVTDETLEVVQRTGFVS